MHHHYANHAVYAHHAVYASHAGGFGGSWFMHALVAGFIHSIIWHMVAPLFRGQNLIGTLMIGGGLLLAAYLLWKRFSEPSMLSVSAARRWRSR